MRSSKTKLFPWIIFFSIAFLSVVMPHTTEAASITISPDQFQVYSNPAEYEQHAAYLRTTSTLYGYMFFAVPKLPVGARITKILYYHWGIGAPASTVLYLNRVKVGQEQEQVAHESSQDTTNAILEVNVPITGDPVVKKGYRYTVEVWAMTIDSRFCGVKIFYQ